MIKLANGLFFLFAVFGGYGNTKIVIRKRIQNYPLKEYQLSSVISELRPYKVLIEISKSKYYWSFIFPIKSNWNKHNIDIDIDNKTPNSSRHLFLEENENNFCVDILKGGFIKVFGDNKPEPIIEAYDPFVLPVEYVSFASYQGANVEFLYNCISDKTTIDTSNDIKKQPVVPQTNDLSEVSLEGT